MKAVGRVVEGAIEAGWLAAAVVTPLFLNKNGAHVFDAAKAGILRTLAVLVLSAWACRALLWPKEKSETPWPRAARFVMGAGVALVVATALSTVWSVVRHDSIWGQRERAQGLFTLVCTVGLFAAAVVHVRTPAQMQRLVSALLFPSVPISVYAIFQRLHWEPLSIGGRETEIERATSLLGQPVFLGAYLALLLPLCGLRLQQSVARAKEAGGRSAVFFYGLLFCLQVAALLVTESRGPLAGALVAGAIALVCVIARRRWRRLAGASLALVVLGAVALAMKAPQRLIGTTADSGRLAKRAADTFQTRGGGRVFRQENWKVAARIAAQTGTPLAFADDGSDLHLTVRPFLGYGPESQGAIAPAFYDAEITTLFRHFAADRFHNEFWDAAITTGIFGLLSTLAVQLALLFAGVSALGHLSTRKRLAAFWGAVVGSGLIAGGVALLIGGAAMVFFWLQVGLIAGLSLFVVAQAFLPAPATPVPANQSLATALLAALCGHFVEVSFSFTTVTTGLVFWFVGALLVLQHLQLESDAPPTPAAKPTKKSPATPAFNWRRPASVVALVLLANTALAFAFLRPTRAHSAGDVLWQSLTTLEGPPARTVPVFAMLLVVTIAAGLWLFATDKSQPQKLSAIATATVAGSFAFMLFLSKTVSALAAKTRGAQAALQRNLEIRDDATTAVYVAVVIAVAVLAWTLGSPIKTSASVRQKKLRWTAVPIVALVAAWGLWTGGLRAAFAEHATSVGDAYRSVATATALPLAEQAYERALALVPNADSHHAQLAKAYAKHADLDPTAAEQWLARADDELARATTLNRAGSENAVNRAIVYAAWTARAPSQDRRTELMEKTRAAFLRALRLDPQDPALLRRWAIAQLKLFNDPIGAVEAAKHAAALEPLNESFKQLVEECERAAERHAAGAR